MAHVVDNPGGVSWDEWRSRHAADATEGKRRIGHRVSDLPSRYVDPVFGLNGRSCQVEDFELVSADHGPLVVPADILDRPRKLEVAAGRGAVMAT